MSRPDFSTRSRGEDSLLRSILKTPEEGCRAGGGDVEEPPGHVASGEQIALRITGGFSDGPSSDSQANKEGGGDDDPVCGINHSDLGFWDVPGGEPLVGLFFEAPGEEGLFDVRKVSRAVEDADLF